MVKGGGYIDKNGSTRSCVDKIVLRKKDIKSSLYDVYNNKCSFLWEVGSLDTLGETMG